MDLRHSRHRRRYYRGARLPLCFVVLSYVNICSQELELEPGVSFWEQYCPTCSKSYRDEFHVAIQRYREGKFEGALEVRGLGRLHHVHSELTPRHKVLNSCLSAWPEDGPALALRQQIRDM